MKKLILFIIIASFISSCKSGEGTLEGNVYWKYNNYVGNRPDAGSTAYLYPFEKNSKPLVQTADLNGNFKFEKVESGQYLLIVRSANTNSSKSDMLKGLLDQSPFLNKVFNINVPSLDPSGIKKFNYTDSLYRNQKIDFDLDNASEQLKIRETLESNNNLVAGDILKKIPSDNALADYVIGSKIKIRMVTIEKDKTDKEVIDFGITYF